MVPLVAPPAEVGKKRVAPRAWPGAPLLSSYTTTHVALDTFTFEIATEEPAGCEAATVIPDKLIVELVPVAEVVLVLVPLVVVVAVPFEAERLLTMPQPRSMPTMSPATKTPT